MSLTRLRNVSNAERTSGAGLCLAVVLMALCLPAWGAAEMRNPVGPGGELRMRRDAVGEACGDRAGKPVKRLERGRLGRGPARPGSRQALARRRRRERQRNKLVHVRGSLGLAAGITRIRARQSNPSP